MFLHVSVILSTGGCLVGGVPGPVGCLFPVGAWSGGPGLGVPGSGGVCSWEGGCLVRGCLLPRGGA